MLKGFSFGGKHFCIYGEKIVNKNCSVVKIQLYFCSGQPRTLHVRFDKEPRSRKGSRNGWVCLLFMFYPYKKSKIHCILQEYWSYINWCCFNWPYDFWKHKETATISCLLPVSRLHMEFFPLRNSQPPITRALINLIENRQQGMLEMIFKLIEKDFQLSYWKIYTYLC